MKKLLLFSSLSAAAILPMTAAHISPEAALARLDHSAVRRVSPSGQSPRFTRTLGNLYLFSAGDGFLILPADDSAPALLGYSDSGYLDPEANPALRDWLEFYNRELSILTTENATGLIAEAKVTARKPIEPMIMTRWNQEAPYNELCPKVDGHETVTGCVATAMAQVMKFYNYPAAGKGTHSYFWRPGEKELTFDYDATPFRWDKMLDVYDRDSPEEARHAVAELMLGCGISVDMHYEPGGSGAATITMGSSLINIFGYSRATWMPNRDYYGYYEWEEMIYGELIQGRPVLYSGAGTAGGHQFICDGYSSDGFFHFNWGWGGISDGYFRLTALNPSSLGVGGGAGGFNSGQVATLGLEPADKEAEPVWLMYNTGEFRAKEGKVKFGDWLSCTGTYFNYSLEAYPENTHVGLKFTSETDGSSRYVVGEGVGGYRTYDGRNGIGVVMPELEEGIYMMTPALRVNGRWVDVRSQLGTPGWIRVTVKDNDALFTDEAPATVRVMAVTLPDVIFRDRDFPMEFTAVNSGSDEYYNNVTPWLLDSAGKRVAKSQYRPLDVLPDDSERVTDYIGRFAAVDNTEFTDGEYDLVFIDNFDRIVSDKVTVKVATDSGRNEVKFTDFRLAQEDPVEHPEDVVFSYRVECESGYYFSAPHMDVFPGEGGYNVASADGERIYLVEGESRESELKADLSYLRDGEYLAALYYDGRMVSSLVRFSIKRLETSVGKLMSPKNESADYYDFTGRRCTPPLSPGLYLHEGRKVVIH